MNATRTRDTYRRLRGERWRSWEALRFAKDDQELEEAEEAGLIRFRWEMDDDYDPYFWVSDGGITEQDADEENKQLANGFLYAMGCVAEVPSRLAVPVVFMGSEDTEEGWKVRDSLWGIVSPWDRTDQDYRRSVEIDLAYGTGVLK